jgi:hypothetical protein
VACYQSLWRAGDLGIALPRSGLLKWASNGDKGFGVPDGSGPTWQSTHLAGEWAGLAGGQVGQAGVGVHGER